MEDECTSLEGSEVTLTWRFISNGDGINGNAGLAGFAIDNIRFEEFTFEDDGNYSVEVNGLDSQESQVVNLGTHDFDSGLSGIDVRTIFDNNDPTQKWYNAEEVNPSNNFSKGPVQHRRRRNHPPAAQCSGLRWRCDL